MTRAVLYLSPVNFSSVDKLKTFAFAILTLTVKNKHSTGILKTAFD